MMLSSSPTSPVSSIYLSLLSRQFSDHHLRCGGRTKSRVEIGDETTFALGTKRHVTINFVTSYSPLKSLGLKVRKGRCTENKFLENNCQLNSNFLQLISKLAKQPILPDIASIHALQYTVFKIS